MDKDLKSSLTRQITYFAVLAALTVVLQLVGNTVRIGPVTLNFSLIPIVLCGLLLGVWYGAALGGLTGLIILLHNGILGADGFTNILFATDPIVIILVCILKTGIAGAVCPLIYKAFRKKNELLAVILASASVPVINSGLFAVGMFLIVPSLVSQGFIADGVSAAYTIFIGFIGLNFVFEFALNLIVAPAIYRVVRVVEKRFTSGDEKVISDEIEEESEINEENKTEGEE